MIIHVVACLALIAIVLLQTGRGAEMGAAFGGASQTLFGGGGGSTFLGKLTTGAAVVFMVTCLSLTYLSAGPSTKSIMETAPIEQQPQGPAIPEAKPVQPAPPASPEASKPQESAPASQTSAAPETQAPAVQSPQQEQQPAPGKQ